MLQNPDTPKVDLAAARRAYDAALVRGRAELGTERLAADVPTVLAGAVRDVVVLSISVQMLEQVLWLDRREDPLPDGVLELATNNVLRLSATVIAALDHVLTSIDVDDHAPAIWTIEALRTAQAALGPERCAMFEMRLGTDLSDELIAMGAAVGQAAVGAYDSGLELAPRVVDALGQATTIFIASAMLAPEPPAPS